jgi:hypothetical protein
MKKTRLMSNIFIDWAVKKFPNDADLGAVFREFHTLNKLDGTQWAKSSRKAEEQIMTKYFN